MCVRASDFACLLHTQEEASHLIPPGCCCQCALVVVYVCVKHVFPTALQHGPVSWGSDRPRGRSSEDGNFLWSFSAANSDSFH